MQSVFFIGIARSGSKIYKYILNEYSDVNVMKELHYFAPFWVRRDFRRNAEKSIGSGNKANKVDRLIELMYSDMLNGSFWALKKEGESIHGIEDIDREELKIALLRSDNSYESIFKIILELHTKSEGKKICGAKYPMDISYTHKLTKWFPESKIIHIIRDPRAIFTSMYKADLRKIKSKSSIIKFIISLRRLFYCIAQYKISHKVFLQYQDYSNYYLSKYEDIVSGEHYVIKMCEFLEIPYREEMLRLPVMKSSYRAGKRDGGKYGLDKQGINRWRDHIPKTAEAIINLLLQNEMKSFGYHK